MHKNTLNIVQIRNWQQCDYIIQYIYIDNKLFTFFIKKNQMIDECKKLNVQQCHGNNESNKNNSNIEYRLSIKYNSKEWIDWCNKYLVKNNDLESII